MLEKQLTTLTKLGIKNPLSNIFLVLNAFVWYFVVLSFFLQEVVTKMPSSNVFSAIMVWGLHFSGLIISAIYGTFISKKVEYRQLIILWIVLSALSSLSIALINPSDIRQISLIGLLLGVSLGFGMPACIGRYADSLPVENRGRIGGFTLFTTGIGIAAFSLSGISNFLILGIGLFIWRLSGLIIFLLAKVPSSLKVAKKSSSTYKKIISQKSFIFYFIPWIMFSLINYLVAPVNPTLGEGDSGNIALVQTGFMGIFALLGGFFIDSIGRKRIAVSGFILLGLGTAVLGISSTSLPILYFNAILDGTAWGLLLLLFILTLWGDLSFGEPSEKYYALGVIPFFVSKFLDLTVGSLISMNLSNSPALFSFGAFFLFLAILPLIYAPETLPEKTMRDRDLNSYVEKAKKIVERENAKNQKKNKKNDQGQNSSGETPESSEYKKARELAEKWY